MRQKKPFLKYARPRPDLKRLLRFFTGRISAILHPFVYRALILTYPMDVGGIVLDGRMTPEMGTGSLGSRVPYLRRFPPVFE